MLAWWRGTFHYHAWHSWLCLVSNPVKHYHTQTHNNYSIILSNTTNEYPARCLSHTHTRISRVHNIVTHSSVTQHVVTYTHIYIHTHTSVSHTTSFQFHTTLSHTTLSHTSLFQTTDWCPSRLRIYAIRTFPHTVFFTDPSSAAILFLDFPIAFFTPIPYLLRKLTMLTCRVALVYFDRWPSSTHHFSHVSPWTTSDSDSFHVQDPPSPRAARAACSATSWPFWCCRPSTFSSTAWDIFCICMMQKKKWMVL